MSEAKKRTAQTASEHPERKRLKPREIQGIPDMSLQCAECGGNIADSKAGDKLSFCEDGTSLHLVMSLSNEGRQGIGFVLKEVPAKKKPSEKNPYASVSHVLCGNKRGEKLCYKKIGGVKCYPPLTDNELIFFQHKALLVDNTPPKNWKAVRNSSLSKVQVLPAPPGEKKRRYKPRTWPALVRHVAASDKTGAKKYSGVGLTKTAPRPYQVELFRGVMESERNSLVYLPTGLGKTLVAAMVIKRLLELNDDKQAFFLVETNALAMQQTAQLQKECGGIVEMLVGSSLQAGIENDGNRGLMKLIDVRAARIVVSTAGAFEHAMCKSYIDPDSICCVVLDEAHHCGKEHPFNRVARSFLTSGGRSLSLSLSPPTKGPSEYPKLVALTASPAGEKTVHETVLRIEGLLDRLGADLAAPVETLQEVKARTPRVRLELANVTANPPETALLGCLEKLVLSRVAKVAPKGSDVAMQAKTLLDGLEVRMKDAMAASKVTAAIGADVPRRDDSWRFPNKAYTALCQQALARRASGLEHCTEKSDQGGQDGSDGGGGGGGGGDGGGGGGSSSRKRHTELWNLMSLAFSVDEVGGEAIWRQVLDELEYQKAGRSGGEEGVADAAADDTNHDPALEETIDVITEHLGDNSSDNDSDPGSGAEAGAGGGGRGGTRSVDVTGSKLEKMAGFLKEHKDKCDQSGSPFSALLFVSTRVLAGTTPEMLHEIPLIRSFVKAQAIVGLEEMTLAEQRTALASFKDGPANVLVSTSVCGEGIDVPACALVICASLPNSGTALVQLRGRIRCEENCRFVGLTRNCGTADQEHVQSICLREVNMLEAIEKLSGGGGSNSGETVSSAATSRYASEAPAEPSAAAAAPATAATAAPHAKLSCPPTASATSSSGADSGRVGGTTRALEEALPGYPLFEIPSSSSGTTVAPVPAPAPASTCPEAPGMFSARTSTGEPCEGPKVQLATVVPVKLPAEGGKGAAGAEEGFASIVSSERAGAGSEGGGGFLVAGRGRSSSPTGSVGEDNEWKKELPPRLKPEAENYAAMYLSTCVRQAMQKSPGQMARCIVNTATQLASKIKPVFEYEERKVGGPAHDTVFEARCFVSSKLEELAGLILVQEARAGSIKAAREGAAQKVVQYLLDKQPR